MNRVLRVFLNQLIEDIRFKGESTLDRTDLKLLNELYDKIKNLDD